MNTPSPPPHKQPDVIAATLRGFGVVGILFILAVLAAGAWFGAALVLLWAWRAAVPARDLGLACPRSWWKTILFGVLAGVFCKLLMKIIVMPLLGAPPVNDDFHRLIWNTAALPGTIFAVVVSAGFGEELVWRGFLFERSARKFGRGIGATIATVIVTAVLFGAAHYQYQGWTGVQQAAIMGVVYGSLYAKTRNLWLVVVLHAVFDIAAVLMIYLGVEIGLARLVFK